MGRLTRTSKQAKLCILLGCGYDKRPAVMTDREEKGKAISKVYVWD